MSNITDPKLCPVRTLTFFIVLDKNSNNWEKEICRIAKKAEKLMLKISKEEYEIQTIRIVTNPFSEYLDTSSVSSALADMEKLKAILSSSEMPNIRIRFALGEAKNESDLNILPELISQYGDICNTCVNIGIDEFGFIDNNFLTAAAKTVKIIGDVTPNGEGNFNFTVNFNCPPFIPYFPASYHSGKDHDGGLVLGFESPDLLVAAIKKVNDKKISDQQTYLRATFLEVQNALQFHYEKITNIATEFSLEEDIKFIGIDSSAAPSKDCSSMVDVYKMLGNEYFGSAGTLEKSSFLTRIFKSLKNINFVGFSGLMLAVTEDRGLAEGTIKNHFDIRTLLMNSAVCGIGLDTVPIPGNTPLEKIVALMRDTGTLAFRLNKPLTVRLFPVPNKKAGEMTQFESDDLCNCAILEVR